MKPFAYKRLIYHTANGGVSLRSFDAEGNVVFSELIARFVYADAELVQKLLDATHAEYVRRGEIAADSPVLGKVRAA